MDGSSSGSTGRSGGLGLPPIPPPSNVSNNVVADSSAGIANASQDIVPNPDGGDVPQDPLLKRRAANREYSQRYRLKQHVRLQKLENQQKSLEAEISDKSPQVQYYKEVESYLVAENMSLKEKLSETASHLEAKQAEAEMLRYELEQLQLINEAQKNQISDLMNFKGI